MKINYAQYIVFLALMVFATQCYAKNHVITLTTHQKDKTFFVSPSLSFETSKEIKEAIDNGVRIQFIVKAEIFEHNSWWFDRTIEKGKIILEVSYFTLGKLYVVKNKETGEQQGFNEYENIWTQFENLMSFQFPRTFSDDKWIKLRVMLDEGALPAVMQLPVLFNSNWNINTSWYEQKVGNK